MPDPPYKFSFEVLNHYFLMSKTGTLLRIPQPLHSALISPARVEAPGKIADHRIGCSAEINQQNWDQRLLYNDYARNTVKNAQIFQSFSPCRLFIFLQADHAL